MEKVAVVTGAAKGLGRAIAEALPTQGYTVIVHYRQSVKEASEVLAHIQKGASKSILVRADLTKEAEVEKVFYAILSKFGRIDLLVNNVGSFILKKLSETSNAEFRNLIESNVYAAFYCSQAVLPLMRKQKSGHIINIGAVGAERFNFREKSTLYFWAKNGVYTLTKAMAYEEASYGIHINMISPASLSTDIFKASDFPMKRSATYDDVVRALLFLISPDAYYINGANIEVAGAFIPGMR